MSYKFSQLTNLFTSNIYIVLAALLFSLFPVAFVLMSMN